MLCLRLWFYNHLPQVVTALSRELAFSGLLDISSFIQLFHEPSHSSGDTLDLIICHGLDVSALNVASISSALFEASLASPCTDDMNVFTSRHISLAIMATLSEKTTKESYSLVY